MSGHSESMRVTVMSQDHRISNAIDVLMSKNFLRSNSKLISVKLIGSHNSGMLTIVLLAYSFLV